MEKAIGNMTHLEKCATKETLENPVPLSKNGAFIAGQVCLMGG